MNRFSIAPALQIDLVEEQWDDHPDENGNEIPDPAEELAPLQTVVKDPAVENTTGVEAWVFLEVAVPTYEVAIVQPDGSIAAPAQTELFSYQVNEGWQEMGSASYDEERKATVHRYAYTTPIDPGTRSGTLFDSVTFANLADNQLDETQSGAGAQLSIDIEAFGIQTQGFDTWEAGWEALAEQEQIA